MQIYIFAVRLFSEIMSISITYAMSAPSGTTTAIIDGVAVVKLPFTASLESGRYMKGRSEHDKSHDTDNGGFEKLHGRKMRDGSFNGIVVKPERPLYWQIRQTDSKGSLESIEKACINAAPTDTHSVYARYVYIRLVPRSAPIYQRLCSQWYDVICVNELLEIFHPLLWPQGHQSGTWLPWCPCDLPANWLK